MGLNNKKYKIDELNKEYILIYTNKHDYTDKLANLIDFNELNYIKDFVLLPDDTLYLINDGFYYLKYHNTFIKTYKEPTEMAYAIAVYSETKKQWKDIYKNELQNDFNKYKLTRHKVKKQIDKDNTTTGMDTSSLFGRDLIIQKEWNNKMELLKYKRKLFYNELFVQKIKINSKKEYFISKYSDFKDEKIEILNWKSNKALSLLKLPLNSIELKGYYTPDGNNLIDVRYENSNAQKYYFNNANLELQKDNDNTKKKINIENFFGLKEKIPSSEQARIHSLKNKPIILIEGSAGTGKTTTALEKLAKKSYDGISEEKFLVITKDTIANKYLQNFLNSLLLLKTRIFTIDNFIAYINIEKNFNKIDLEKSEKIANSLVQFYKNITNNIEFYNDKKELKYLMDLYEEYTDMEKIKTYIEKKEKEIFSFNKKIELIETNITKIETEFLENFSDDNILKQYKKITLHHNEIKRLLNFQNKEILDFLRNRYIDSNEKLNKICEKLHKILNKLKLKNHKEKTVQYLTSVLNECNDTDKLYNKLNEYNKLRKKYSKNKIIENIKSYINFLKEENLDDIDNLYKKSGEILFIEDDSYLNIVLDAIEQIPYFREFKKLQRDIANKKIDYKEIDKKIKKLKSEINILTNIKEFNIDNINSIIHINKQDIPYWKAKLFVTEKYNIENIKEDIEPIVIRYFLEVIWSNKVIDYFIDKIIKREKISIQNDLVIKKLSRLYFYKLTDQVDFDTIIVDEIQDFTYQEIELCRLMTKNLILTGDRLQKISQTGIENWEELYKFNELYKNNIYELTLNFRQTYELANLSFNFRKLILKERFKDISSEYYENQKGFPMPSLYIISKVNEFKKIVNNVLLSIQTNYVSVFPCTIVYSTEEEKNFFMATLSKNYKVGIINNTETDFKSYEIILIHINHIKGKEFPVILSFVSTLTEKKIYLIMSRANFELHLFINHENHLLSYFNKLSEKNIIKIIYTDLN